MLAHAPCPINAFSRREVPVRVRVPVPGSLSPTYAYSYTYAYAYTYTAHRDTNPLSPGTRT